MLGTHNANPFGLDEHERKDSIVSTQQLIFPSEKEQPFENVGKTAAQLTEEFPHAEWIFTGDYHSAFDKRITRADGSTCRVVNPGCLMRQVADYMDYSCSVFIVDTARESVERLSIIDSEELVTDVYLRDADAKDERLGAFLDLVSSQQKISLSFKDNLAKKLEQSDIPERVRAEVNTITAKVGAEE